MNLKNVFCSLSLLGGMLACNAQAESWALNWNDYKDTAQFVQQGDGSYAATLNNVSGSGVDLTISLALNGGGTFGAEFGWVNWGYHANGLKITTDFASLSDSLTVSFSFSSAVGDFSYTVYDLGWDSPYPTWGQNLPRTGGFQDGIKNLSASNGSDQVFADEVSAGNRIYNWQDGYYGTHTSSWEHSSTESNVRVVYGENVDRASFNFVAGNTDGQSQSNPQQQTFYIGQINFGEAFSGNPGGAIPEPGTTAAVVAFGALGCAWMMRSRRRSR